MSRYILEATILSGSHKGKYVFLYQINFITIEIDWPIAFYDFQQIWRVKASVIFWRIRIVLYYIVYQVIKQGYCMFEKPLDDFKIVTKYNNSQKYITANVYWKTHFKSRFDLLFIRSNARTGSLVLYSKITQISCVISHKYRCIIRIYVCDIWTNAQQTALKI